MRKIASLFTVLMFFVTLAFGQTRTITGTVTDEAGATVPGASVRIKGTSGGVAADNNGQFRIQAKNGDVIVISGAGLETTEVTVGDNSTISIPVKRIVTTGTEVVVTALGIRRTEKALGYAVTKVDPNSVLQKSEPDLLKGLQGKVPGVDIRQSQGTPGAATRIQLRGNSSFGLETQPLIVVDGIPYSNDQLTTTSQTAGGTAYGSGLANLDPNDIESFSILKGAAAASLYGSRASRGVVVITTKSGSAKKGAKPFNVNFRSGISAERISNLPEYQNTYGSGANFDPRTGSNGSWGAKFGLGNVYDQDGNILRKSASGIDSIAAWATYLAAYPDMFPNNNAAYKAFPNNVKDAFRTGMLYENSINVNGGDANTSLGLTASNVNHLGYVENSSYIRNNVSVGGQTKHNGFTVGGNLSYARSKQKGGFFGNNQTPGASSQFARTMHMARNWDLFGLPSQDLGGVPLAFIAGNYDHPRWAAYHNVITTIEERMVLGLRLGYKVNNWINVNYNIGLNSTHVNRDEVTDEFSRAASGLGQLIKDNLRAQELQSTLVLVFNPKIGTDFSLDFKLGNDINQRNSKRQADIGSDFIVPGIFNLSNTVEKTFAADTRSKRRIVGFFGDATLGYKNFAFINVSGRNDRTSTLPYKNASYFYPGVSASLVFSDAFKLRSNWFDYGKIRAGWAKVGNDAPPHNGEDVFTLSTVNFLGLPYASLSGLPNSGLTVDPDLTPEFTQELEVGLDLSFFKRRINLDFTAYDKTTTDLIFPVSVPTSTGYVSFNTNIGEISNKGVEIGLTVRPVVTKNFAWEIRGAFTKNKNIVEKLVDGLERTSLGGGFTGGVSAWLEPGKPFGYLRGQVADRTADGQLLIDPTTGWIIEALDQGEIGDPNPDFKLGITNSISYKGFSLSAVFDMTKGGDFYSNSIYSLLGRGVTKDTEDREALWTIPGVYGNPNTHQPILSGGKTVPNQTRISTNDLFFTGVTGVGGFGINSSDEFNVFDGTVYRLREITLRYSLPKNFVSKLKVADISVSLSGRNLWFLAPNTPKYVNFDPEVGAYGSSVIQGIELDAAPTAKRFGFNLNVTF
ncbi:SusC/RagA family TonB-linked outer membrane protein [Chitinophagaceae bacterium IBVUCB2]|nr:SusC/RagA family TonB-linked outer membrane protein [Chitinophagaceae bacterium IBVUCB2]